MPVSPKYYVTWGCHMSSVTKWDAFSPPICLVALLVAKKTGALTPINQNAIKHGKCGNLERDQTERDKSELDKTHISADPDFAQTDFAQTELTKNHVLQI
jgi:hypothetical protein